ncbi:MAG: FAD-dependent thymidylate synthase [Candidatus Saccharibacteria bacterium]
MNKGKYIVIEGLSNYRDQIIQRLGQELTAARLPVKIMREPESQNDLTARAIHRLTHDPRYPMMNRTEVLLYNAARVQSLEVIRQAVNNGVQCLVDRSYLTTLVVQYYGLGTVPDYQKITEVIRFAVGDMEADLTIVLDTPVVELTKDVQTKFTDHRTDDGFLERVRAGYLWEAKQRGLPVVYADDDIDAVFKQVWQHVTDTLAIRDKAAPESQPQSVAAVLAANPPVKAMPADPPAAQAKSEAAAPPTPQPDDSVWTRKHDNGSMSVTASGKAELAKFVTNTEGSVYSFTEAISPITIAAAMARLSRRGDDMRVTLLDEFIGKVEKDEQLLHRVITAYGDDSVQQLGGQYIVVENASNLLTKKLEWGRLASYLEQSTRYIYFDQKDSNGHYRYFVPPELKGKLRSQYIRTMNQIFDTYSKIVADLTTYIRANSKTPKAEQDAAWRSATKAQACDAARPLLPVATKSTVGIYASGQALENLIMHLQSDELPEARAVGQQILDEARKVIPVFLERADKPERGGAMIAYRANTYANVRKLALELLPANHTSEEAEAVTLTDYTPRNELDIVADMLYEHSDLPLETLRQEITGWPYERKIDVLTAYMGERLNRRHRPRPRD